MFFGLKCLHYFAGRAGYKLEQSIYLLVSVTSEAQIKRDKFSNL